MMRIQIVATVLAVLWTAACGGGSTTSVTQHGAGGASLTPEQREQVANSEAALTELATQLSQACGAQIAIQVDYASLAGTDYERRSISSFCGYPADALIEWCGRPNTQQYVASHVRELRCTYQQAEDFGLSAADGVLTWHINWAATNGVTKAKTALMEHL